MKWDHPAVSRRGVVTGGAALLTSTLLPQAATRAEAQPPARWRRYDVASAEGQQMLASYAAAVAALLKLPPTDRRNWYRIAFTHYLDCPHGNWWLFPWHRGFTGWVEQIVRQFSGNPNFAFPYWDWTANPEVPAAMSQGVLTPASSAFIPDVATFAATFKPALAGAGYFNAGSPQLQQLSFRGITSNAILWDQITNPNNPQYPSFFPAAGVPNVRNPAAQLDCVASKAVSGQTVAAAMAATAYVRAPQDPVTGGNFFSSPPAAHHSDMAGFSVLEGQPHNLVHNNTGGVVYPEVGGVCGKTPTDTGGFMQAFLSPVDPLFFLHHSNIDRLWTAWTQKQMQAGLPTLPTGPDLPTWSKEPFLFFCNAAGNALPQAKAGDYATIGSFAYDYQPGSVGTGGRKILGGAVPARPLRLVAHPLHGAAAGGMAVANALTVNADLVALAASSRADGAVVSVTLSLPHAPRGQAFPVMVDAGDGGTVEVGRVALFGHAMAHGPLTFALPFGAALGELRRRGALKPNGLLRFTASAPPAGAVANLAARNATDIPVQAVVITGN